MVNKQKQFDRQNDYNRSQYDRIGLMLPKGEKERLQEIANAQGVSLNGLIKTAIDEYVKRLQEVQT